MLKEGNQTQEFPWCGYEVQEQKKLVYGLEIKIVVKVGLDEAGQEGIFWDLGVLYIDLDGSYMG